MDKKSKKVIFIVITILIASTILNIFVVGRLVNSSNKKYIDSQNKQSFNLNQNKIYNIKKSSQPFDKAKPRPVSITSISDNILAFADYINIYLVKINGNNDFELKRPNIVYSKSLSEQNDIFSSDDSAELPYELDGNTNPTGVFYDRSNDNLYIANYNYHNVLVGKISSNFSEIQVNKVISDPDMVSPENVYVDNENNIIVVADYDKSGIFVFNMDGKLKWKKLGLSMAHGVLVYKNNIYVSLLGDIKLMKYDLNGNLLDKVTNVGFNEGEYLYPTTLVAVPDKLRKYYKGDIMVTDARTGAISILDTDLKIVDRFGTNGPKDNEFNLPYGLECIDDKVFVGDTGKRRIVVIDPSQSEYSYLTFQEQNNIGEKQEYGNSKETYVSKKAAPIEFTKFIKENFINQENLLAMPAFQTTAIFLNGERYFDIILPFKDGKFGFENRPIYGFGFTWMYVKKDQQTNYILIGSNDKSQVMVVDTSTNFYDIIDIPEEFVIWGPSENDNRYMDFMFDYSINKFNDNVGNKFKDYLSKYNNSKLSAYIALYYKTPQNFYKEVNNNMYTSMGKVLTNKWLNGEKINLDIHDYFKKSEPLTWDELYLLKLMSSTPKSDIDKLFGKN